jgi:hypothetical protein
VCTTPGPPWGKARGIRPRLDKHAYAILHIPGTNPQHQCAAPTRSTSSRPAAPRDDRPGDELGGRQHPPRSASGRLAKAVAGRPTAPGAGGRHLGGGLRLEEGRDAPPAPPRPRPAPPPPSGSHTPPPRRPGLRRAERSRTRRHQPAWQHLRRRAHRPGPLGQSTAATAGRWPRGPR